LRILAEEFAEQPTPRTAFYLGTTHRDGGRWREAADMFGRRIAMGEGFRDEWLFAHLYRGRCERALGDVVTAERTLLEAASRDDTKVTRARPKPLDPGQPPVRRNWSYGLLLVLLGLVLLVLVALAAWFSDRRHEQKSGPGQAPPLVAAPPAPAPRPAASAPVPTPQPAAPLEVSLDFTQDCWVSALIDGKNRLAEQRVQGEALQLEAQKSIVLTLGNAGGVEVQVNGYPLELGKKQGDVVKDLLIDLDTVQALKAKKETR